MKTPNVNNENICIIAGMPRAATTFLYHTLQKHPHVFIPPRKETDFFAVNYYRGINWYLNFYKTMPPHTIGFDISPIYFFDKHSPLRILQFNPHSKVILIIRNPVDFILSFYKHSLKSVSRAKSKDFSFKKFLKRYEYEKDGKTLKLEFSNNTIKNNILNFCNIFRDNLLLCDFTIFENDPLPILKAIEKFVAIPSFFNSYNFRNVKINASDKTPPRFINILMQKKYFADLVTKIFPKKLIVFLRYKLQVSNCKHMKTPRKNKPIDENVKLATRVFANDVNFVAELFKNSNIILGTGTPFDYS